MKARGAQAAPAQEPARAHSPHLQKKHRTEIKKDKEISGAMPEDAQPSRGQDKVAEILAALSQDKYAKAADDLAKHFSATTFRKGVFASLLRDLAPGHLAPLLSALFAASAVGPGLALCYQAHADLPPDCIDDVLSAFSKGHAKVADVRALCALVSADRLARNIATWPAMLAHAALVECKSLAPLLPFSFWQTFGAALAKMSGTRGALLASCMTAKFFPPQHVKALVDALRTAGHEDIGAAVSVVLGTPALAGPPLRLPSRITTMMVDSADTIVQARRILAATRVVGLDQARTI